MTSSCLSAATSPAISSRIAHESLLQDFFLAARLGVRRSARKDTSFGWKLKA